MHEFGLAENTLAIALEKARDQGAEKIHRVAMQIGALAGVERDAFEFAFNAIAAGTMADGARLEIEPVSISCYCSRCGREFGTTGFSYRCPVCGEASTEIRHGREMNIVSMEVS